MRNYVFYYIQLLNSLQIRKTHMFWNSSFNDDNARKRFNIFNKFNIFIDAKYQFYKILQKIFNKLIFSMYHDFTRQLYVNVNVSHERDFNVIVYHNKDEKSFNNYDKKNIKFILFFNKIFISTEIRYWFIEFETIDLIWLMKRIRHIIETTRLKSQIIIYINHSIITNIIKQIKFVFNDTNKLNFRLMRVSIYLF